MKVQVSVNEDSQHLADIQTERERIKSFHKHNNKKVFGLLEPLPRARGHHDYWKMMSESNIQEKPLPCEGKGLCETGGCVSCTIPSGTWVRVVKGDEPMNRDTSKTCAGE